MEGKKKYFALIIFLFLGLMIFTFANPAEEEKEFTGGDKEQSETVTDKRQDTTEEDDEDEQEQQDAGQAPQNVVTNNNQGNAQGNQGNNAGQQNTDPVDNTLRDALAAVEKAEGTYTQTDVDAAKDLVNNVTDTTEKGKLEERLEEVEAGIAVLALLEQLENKVEEAEEKAHMTEATTFRDTNEIANKIEALNNETVKEELEKRLTEVSKLLDDNDAPTTKVEAKVYADDVVITATDAAGNPFKMFLTKNDEPEKEISSGSTTDSDGTYTLRLVDDAFNEYKVTFTVDKTAPALKDLTSGGHYNEITLNTEDLTKVTIEVTNQDKNETTKVEEGTKLTEEATYKVVLTDEAGNTATYWLAIDSTKPTVSVKDETVEEKAYINEDTEIKVFDKFLTNVSITHEDTKSNKTTEEFTRVDFDVKENNENFTLTYELTKVGTYTITGTDKYGNEKTVTVIYDKTAAKKNAVNANVNGYKNEVKEQYATNGKTISAYISINEELKHNPTFTFYANGKQIKVVKDEVVKSNSTNPEYPYVYTAKLEINEELVAEDGLVTFTVTDVVDKAGNKTEDITPVGNKTITLDRTAAKSTYVAILSNGTEDYKYIKNGEKLRVLAAFNEEINVTDNFVLTINNKNYKFQRSKDTSRYEYIVEFKIPENESTMPEGQVEFSISGYEDLAGNTAKEPLTVATHGKYNTLTYDRTPNRVTQTFFRGDNNVDNVYYVTNGSTVQFNIGFREKLSKDAVVTIGGKEVALKYEKYYEATNSHMYYGDLTIAEDETSLEEGTLEIKISNVTDLAGNTGFYYETNGKKVLPEYATKVTTNGQSVVYDRTPNRVTQTFFRGDNNVDNVYYVTNGSTIQFNIGFREKLSKDAVVTIGGKEVALKYEKYYEATNSHMYYGDLTIAEDETALKEGTLEIKISNVTDLAGNTGFYYQTNGKKVLPEYTAKVTTNGQSVVYDVTAPEVTPSYTEKTVEGDKNGTFTDYPTFDVKDNSNATVKEELISGSVDMTKTGDYKLVYRFTDVVGKYTDVEIKITVVDTTLPVVTINGDDVITVEAGSEYVELGATVTDNIDADKQIGTQTPSYIKLYELGEDGKSTGPYVRQLEKNATIDTSVVGKYLIVYRTTDAAGNMSNKDLLEAKRWVIVKDTTPATIELPGKEGRKANEYRILEGSFIDVEYLYAKITDNVDEDKEILPTSFRKYYPSETGKSSHKYTLEERTIEVNEKEVVQKYFDTSTAGEYYEVKYEYTDASNNKTSKTMLLVVDALYEPEIVNNEINLNKNITLNDRPFFNDKTRTEPLTINGNGKTITQEIDTAYKYTWDITGTRPMQSNMFTSANNSLVTVNNLTFKGSMYSMTLGHYRKSNQGGFTTILNNVNMINTKVASFSAGISPAMSIYGKATLNNVNVYGTTLSELDTDSKYPVYDLALTHFSNTTINGGKIGTIYTWPKAYLEINNAEIDTITSQIRKTNDFANGELLIGEGTKVNKVIIKNKNAVLTVKAGATVDTLDISAYDESTMTLNIEPGATINKVITKDGEMTYSEWYKLITTKEKLYTALALGGELKMVNDIATSKMLTIPNNVDVTLNMNGKKLSLANNFVSDKYGFESMIEVSREASLTITGNGTFDLGKNYDAALMLPFGDVTIENGNFLRATGGEGYISMFVGITNGTGQLVINDGYFDAGSYNAENLHDNADHGLNLSTNQYVRVYGGTFVGQNPAYGDASWANTSPVAKPNSCQGTFFEGQEVTDTEIPSAYTVTESTHKDGRPTYTVSYRMPQ